jgi:adenylate cyclase
LRRLQWAAEKLAHFGVPDSALSHSRVLEIDELTHSIARVRTALTQFGKYVPKAVVRDLMQTDIPLNIGGERRELSMMMTDVAGFVRIAEGESPERLFTDMSGYFENMVGVILGHHGTVDKFVGDAIFAYWNAPLRLDDHCGALCEAALGCSLASRQFNATQRAMGRPEWTTRFGLHVGEAIVGNVGTGDRLDFTAIGNNINVTARLESLNKFYGTQILATADLVDRVKDRYLFRYVDRVVVKGSSRPIDI